jgi:hypothetical protein
MNTESSTLLPVILKPQSLGHSHLKRKRSPSKERPAGRAADVSLENKRPKLLLRIIIPSSLNSGLEAPKQSSSGSLFSAIDSVDSLFDESAGDSSVDTIDDVLARRIGPPVSGLFFDPSVLLPQDIADAVVAFCMQTYFVSPLDNQVMLFGRFAPTDSALPSTSGLPRILLDLLDTISALLKPVIPQGTHTLLFPAEPTRARQAIINLYQPGEGITPHVDLLGRYGDGIVGVSFASGCAMRFDKVEQEGAHQQRYDVYLPERSMIVMTEDARYGWTHGIDKKTRDFVAPLDSTAMSDGVWLERGMRMSVTFRWLLPGADVVGESKE